LLIKQCRLHIIMKQYQEYSSDQGVVSMRIENPTNRNSSNAFQRKNKLKKNAKTQDSSYENSDSLDLSSGVVLLNHLLNEADFQYKPVPFYFTNSLMRNRQQASNIAKAIQQKAMSYDVNLNYEMILDLVLSHENEKSSKTHLSTTSNVTQSTAYQHIPLRENETIFFERFHNSSIASNVSPTLVSVIVVEYFQFKQARKIIITTETEQIKLLSSIINTSANQNISRNKSQILELLQNDSS